MIELGRHFQNAFGIPLSALPIPAGLVRIGSHALLYGSPAAQKQPLLTQSEAGLFLERPREGYFLVGFWGHGINSYAFYYVRDEGKSRIYLRLSYGGVYTDNEEHARRVAAFLPAFVDFERNEIGAGSALMAIDSMGWGDYRVTTREGILLRYSRSLFLHAGLSGKVDFSAFVREHRDPDLPV